MITLSLLAFLSNGIYLHATYHYLSEITVYSEADYMIDRFLRFYENYHDANREGYHD